MYIVSFMVGLLIGLIAGAFLGIAILALCVAASGESRRREKEHDSTTGD